MDTGEDLYSAEDPWPPGKQHRYRRAQEAFGACSKKKKEEEAVSIPQCLLPRVLTGSLVQATDEDQKALNEQALRFALAAVFDMAVAAQAQPMQFHLPGTSQPVFRRILDLSLLMTNAGLAEPGELTSPTMLDMQKQHMKQSSESSHPTSYPLDALSRLANKHATLCNHPLQQAPADSQEHGCAAFLLFLVEDIAEMSTVEAAPAIFDLLEERQHLFTSEKGRSLMCTNTSQKLSLLKTCKQVPVLCLPS